LKKAFGDGAEYAFLINNDTIVDRCCLSRLVAAAEIYPDAGLIGPAIYYFEKSGTIWSAGSTIDLKRGAWTHNKTVPDEDAFFEVDGLTGCAILVRRDAVLTAGYIDPAFFLYVEDFEWNLRIKKCGFKAICVPEAKVWHKIGRSTGGLNSPFFYYYSIRNRLLLMRKHATFTEWCYFIPFFLRNLLLDALLKVLNREKRFLGIAMFQGIGDFIKGSYGKGKNY